VFWDGGKEFIVNPDNLSFDLTNPDPAFKFTKLNPPVKFFYLIKKVSNPERI